MSCGALAMRGRRANVRDETKRSGNEWRSSYHCALDYPTTSAGGDYQIWGSRPVSYFVSGNVLGSLYSNTLLYPFSYPREWRVVYLSGIECDQMGLFALEQFSASQPHTLIGGGKGWAETLEAKKWQHVKRISSQNRQRTADIFPFEIIIFIAKIAKKNSENYKLSERLIMGRTKQLNNNREMKE